MSNKFKPTISEQTAKELEMFLLERELGRELTDYDMFSDLANNPVIQVQLDVIAHLEELRDVMNKKIDLMKMRTKNIY
jgi:hypothetical protein